MSAFHGWENFYVILGSAAGALIGLQFVVMTLIAGLPIAENNAQDGKAYSTPTVVHFAVVLLLSAVVSAPWSGTGTVAALLGLVGLSGLAYIVSVARHLRHQAAISNTYTPVLEDWTCHVLLPGAAYALLVTATFVARFHSRPSLFMVAGAALLLLFIGVHNAWDLVTFHVFVKRQSKKEERNG